MTPKQHYLNLAQRAMETYVTFPYDLRQIEDTAERWLWLDDGPDGSEARCLYFCLLAAMEE